MPYHPPEPALDKTCEAWPRAYFTHTIPLSHLHTALLEMPRTVTDFEWTNFMAYLDVVKQVVVAPVEAAPEEKS